MRIHNESLEAAYKAIDTTLIGGRPLADSTKNAYRSALKVVVEAQDDPGRVDLLADDIDDLLAKFTEVRRERLSDRSLESYMARFRRALDLFRVYRPNDGSPVPQVVAAPTATYYMPLRPNLMVKLELPVDLTNADAKRVAAFVQSLAFDEEA